MQMMVSIIIPVYNVEQYLAICVDSILMQSYYDFEILLINDGSTDNSPKICDSLAYKDSRIKVFHKSNGGLSDARNYGLLNATGDYVIFLDSDDFWCHEDDLQRLMDVAESHPEVDFVGFNCQYYFEDKRSYVKWVAYSEELSNPVTGDFAFQLLVQSGTVPMSACLKLMKKSLLINESLTFRKGQIAEDIPWFINLIEKSKSCMFINQYVYAYRQNVTGSITSSAGARSFNSLFSIVETEVQKLHERSFTEEARNALLSFLAYEFCILLASVDAMPKGIEQELLEYRWLLNYTLNPKVRKAAFVNNLFGIKITKYLLRLYSNKQRK